MGGESDGSARGWTDPNCVHVDEFPGFEKEIYKRMLPDKTQKNYYKGGKRWETCAFLRRRCSRTNT